MADKIFNLAGPLSNDLQSTGHEPGRIFRSANAGSLVNCIPPPNLCPLGPVEYLHEMLQIQSGDSRLIDVISSRRSNVGSLHATMASVATQISTTDLILESLESLGDDQSISHGAIYDTADHSLNGFDLGEEGHGVNAEALLAAIPEHSSPAILVEKPAVYGKLERCFTSADLPYSRSLDISHSYLSRLGTNRFKTMLHFRREITEFPLDPSHDPDDFQKHLWRLPVRLDIALEYLQIFEIEYNILYAGNLTAMQIPELYGFKYTEMRSWQSAVLNLPVFLRSTGLAYCEFLDLFRCQYESFKVENTVARDETMGERVETLPLPQCLPCCIEAWRIVFPEEDATGPLTRLIIFIRLWQKLKLRCDELISFQRLADVCNVLELFKIQGDVNPDFLRQLVALLMLHERFGLPWTDGVTTATIRGAETTKLLGIWADPQRSSADWTWAITVLLTCVEDYAEEYFRCRRRSAEFLKIIYDNLDPLSYLAGFTETDRWSLSPVCTIRFVEVLTKIYASNFTVGEILFLFTVREHLNGDDPFPLSSAHESLNRPLSLPDNQIHNLEALRRKLLDVEVCLDKCESWGWHRIESVIRGIGFTSKKSADGVPDALIVFAEHFFPHILEENGHPVGLEQRRFICTLAPSSTSPKMWSVEPCKPFHYAVKTAKENSGQLWMQLPLRDEDVLRKLRAVRQLKPAETEAVQNLYFLPRAALAPFALLFSNFGHAVDILIQEPCERKRFDFFRHEVILFHRRCEIIAEHLAEHVRIATSEDWGERRCPSIRAAWRVLESLTADENIASEAWEDDLGHGKPPAQFMWDPHFSGSAFAAILGLIGTGLLGKHRSRSGTPWVEMRGGVNAFGCENNEWNTPVLTLIPSLDVQPSTAQDEFVTFKNGIAFRDMDSEQLTGVESFESIWTGSLLVDQAGSYRFSGGGPTPGDDLPRIKDCDGSQWLLEIQRGQKSYTLLNHGWHGEGAPDHISLPVHLYEGTYAITAKFKQVKPTFTERQGIDRIKTGFQIKYQGPDTDGCTKEVPFCRLVIDSKDGPLGRRLKLTQAAEDFLSFRYVSSIRDIRRTYQRAFKAILFAHRFRLSAKEIYCDDQSELGYLLENAQQFKGTSYFRPKDASTFQPHYTWFDFNFLPVADPFLSPDSSVDTRVSPSHQRQAALFDWWERIFDYICLRQRVREIGKRPIWLLFREVAVQKPAEAEHLIRYLGIDLNLPRLALDYFNDGIYTVKPTDLLDEQWTIPLWHAREWIRALYHRFYTDILDEARPALWASDDPGINIDSTSGNANLMYFLQHSMINAKDLPPRFEALRDLNNGLCQRARKALLLYLCSMERVALLPSSFSTHASAPRDLSDFLLQDVEADINEKTSRLDDVIRSVHAFVQRARMGLEPLFIVTNEFSKLWGHRFACFETWIAWKRRTVYGENWIQWDELRALEQLEGFEFLQKELCGMQRLS